LSAVREGNGLPLEAHRVPPRVGLSVVKTQGGAIFLVRA
jgi:hypothetical protein